MKRKLGIIVLVMLIILLSATMLLNRYMKYYAVNDLIILEEMNIVEYSSLKYNAYPKLVFDRDEKLEIHVMSNEDGDDNKFMVDTSANATVVEMNSSEYIIDNEILYGILAKYDTRRSSRDYYPYMYEDVVIEFEVVQNHRTKHFLLGELNIWYEYGDSGFYEIVDGNQLKEEIIDLVNKNAR